MNNRIFLKIMFFISIKIMILGALIPIVYANNHFNDDKIISTEIPENKILIYVLSDRTDSDGWYSGPYFMDTVKDMLEDKDYTVDVEDEITLPVINYSFMINYSQIWILEGDMDNIVEVTTAEADDLYAFYENGGGIWISMEMSGPYNKEHWSEDACVFANKFGVDSGIDVTGSSSGKPVDSSHPLFDDVNYIFFNNYVGSIVSTNPDVEMIWEYKPNADGIAILNEHEDSKGKVVFDSGWMLGFASGIKNEGIPYYDDLIFAKNVAEWLIDTVSPKIEIIQPQNAIYIFNNQILQWPFKPFIVGKITIKVNATDEGTGIEKVEFYIDNETEPSFVDNESPYNWNWSTSIIERIKSPFKNEYKITAIAYDVDGNTKSDELIVKRIHPITVMVICGITIIAALLLLSVGT